MIFAFACNKEDPYIDDKIPDEIIGTWVYEWPESNGEIQFICLASYFRPKSTCQAFVLVQLIHGPPTLKSYGLGWSKQLLDEKYFSVCLVLY